MKAGAAAHDRAALFGTGAADGQTCRRRPETEKGAGKQKIRKYEIRIIDIMEPKSQYQGFQPDQTSSCIPSKAGVTLGGSMADSAS